MKQNKPLVAVNCNSANENLIEKYIYLVLRKSDNNMYSLIYDFFS